MITIRSAEQIKKLEGKIYVRYSKSIALDNKRGYSLAYGTKAEAGLSACVIDQSWDTWRILRQIGEYKFCGTNCWIITGNEIGRGEDNEELLKDVVVIGKVSNDLVNSDWLKMWRDELLSSEKQRHENAKDEWNKNFTAKMIAKLESDDRRIWERIMFQGT